jgi:hypothetical protein
LWLAWTVSSTHARAQPSEPVELEWNAPAECPRLEDVQARIRKLAGARRSSIRPHAVATVTRSGDGQFQLSLLVRTDDGSGTRKIEGKSCEALAGATAVALVLLLQSSEPKEEVDLDGSSPAGEEPDRNPSATEEAARVVEPPPPEPQPAPQADRPRHVLVRLPAGTIGWGPVPGPSAGVTAAVGLQLERWRFLAGGTVWLDQHASRSDASQEYGGDIHRVTGQLQVCRSVAGAQLELAPCAGLYVHHLWARGTGAHIASRTATATWLAVALGVQARLHMTPWLAVVLGVGGEVETSRPRLSLEDVGRVEQLLPVAATMTVGTEWMF